MELTGGHRKDLAYGLSWPRDGLGAAISKHTPVVSRLGAAARKNLAPKNASGGNVLAGLA
jgi:hypothetical protein